MPRSRAYAILWHSDNSAGARRWQTFHLAVLGAGLLAVTLSSIDELPRMVENALTTIIVVAALIFLAEYALRIWVPSCATGEEAYSVAIALRECMERLHRHCDVQIFASDLDPRAIEFARAGKYPEGIAADVPTAWLTRYFTVRDQQYIVNKEIRNLVVFAPHNALSDPPFTRLDWVSCRNLLIYLDVELQKRLLRLFHYALKPGGLLFLGTSESIGDHDDLFDVVDRRWRIFSRRQAQRNTSFAAFPVAVSAVEHLPLPASSAPIGREQPISHLVEQVLLSRYSPPGVVVNQRGDVVYIHGPDATSSLPPAASRDSTSSTWPVKASATNSVWHCIRQEPASGKSSARTCG